MPTRKVSPRQLTPGMRLTDLAVIIRAYPCPHCHTRKQSYFVFTAEYDPILLRVEIGVTHVRGDQYIDIIEEEGPPIYHP